MFCSPSGCIPAAEKRTLPLVRLGEHRIKSPEVSHDSKIKVRSIPAVLSQKEPQNWTPTQSRHVQYKKSRTGPRACGSILQTRLYAACSTIQLCDKAQPALFSREENSDRHSKHSQGGDPTHHPQIQRNRKLSHHFSTCSQMHNDCHHGCGNHTI